jgi:hypothetical protein
MKKWLAAALSFALVLGGAAYFPKTPNAYAADPAVLFEDDFNAYATNDKYIEEDEEFRKSWSNDLMENINGVKDGPSDVPGEQSDYPVDTECKQVAKIVKDPADASNKVLYIKNYDPIGSFFYIAPKAVKGLTSFKDEKNSAGEVTQAGLGLKAKDYEVTFRVYSTRSTDAPWLGVSARKKENVRYNGADNMLLTFKLNENSVSGYQVYSYLPLRGYPSGNPAALDARLDTVEQVYGGINRLGESNPTYVQNKVSNLTAPVGGTIDNANRGIMNTWVTFRLIVKDNTYAAYAYQGSIETYLGCFEYATSLKDAGYLSLNACMEDAYIDDFKVTECTGYENKEFYHGMEGDGATIVNAKTGVDKAVSVNNEVKIPLADMFTVSGYAGDIYYTSSHGSAKGGFFTFTPDAEGVFNITVTCLDGEEGKYSVTAYTFKLSVTEDGAAVIVPPEASGCGSVLPGAAAGNIFPLFALCIFACFAIASRKSR